MKIVFLDEYSMAGADLEAIRALGEYTAYDRTRPEEVTKRCKDADIIISNKVLITDQIMEELPKLKMIAIAATGMNNVDLDAAARRGITVKNAIGYSTSAVAEATLCKVLALKQSLLYYDRYFKSGSYAATEDIFHSARPVGQIEGKRWGIVGLGAIGRRTAALAQAFGCEVAYASTSGAVREEAITRMDLNELLQWAEIITVHCPLTPSTRDLISWKELNLCRRDAILVNVARGGIVNEDALARALNEGVIAGAALDVFTSEPLHDSALYHLTDPDRLIASPHTAWAAKEAIERLVECIARNIREFQQSL